MSDYADVVSYCDEELGVEVSYVTSHYDGYDSSTDRYVSVYDYTELKRDMEALRAELAALREDAAVGAAIREFVEQPTDAWEEVNLIIQVVKSGASFSWQAEIDNKVCLFVTNNISGTDFPKQHISVHGDTLAAALAAAGLMEEGK